MKWRRASGRRPVRNRFFRQCSKWRHRAFRALRVESLECRTLLDGTAIGAASLPGGAAPGQFAGATSDAVASDLIELPLVPYEERAESESPAPPAPAQPTAEQEPNNALEDATELPLVENTTTPGLFQATGTGWIDSSDESDYWSFTAKVYDRVMVYTESPTRDLETKTSLYDPAGQLLSTDYYGGTATDDLIVEAPVLAEGTYFIRVESPSARDEGAYAVHVIVARGMELESDVNRANDEVSGANFVYPYGTGIHSRAQVVGMMQRATASGVSDVDTFQVSVVAERVIELTARSPAGSTFGGSVRFLDAGGNEVPDEDGNPFDGHFKAVLHSSDRHYAQVYQPVWVHDGHRYLVASGRTWLDAQAYAQSLGGYLVSINDQAENDWVSETFGTLPSFWIGLSDSAVEGDWSHWMDGSTVDYGNWAPDQPIDLEDHDFARWRNDTGLWYAEPDSAAFPSVIEIPGTGGLPEGTQPGPEAIYVLDIDLANVISPRVATVTRLSDEDEIDEWIATFEIEFTKSLYWRSAATPDEHYASRNGHFYVLTDESFSWFDAESYAHRLGGQLVTVDDAAEMQWLWETFGDASPQFWIGLNDMVEEGSWVWPNRKPPTYTNWMEGQPLQGEDRDYVYATTGGQWAVAGTGSLRALIEIPDMTDSDGDGMPDGYDPLPHETRPLLDLREAGTDGLFDTSDDRLYELKYESGSSSGQPRINVTVLGGPLGPGSYQLRLPSGVTDSVGNRLDGNGDGVGGDDFVRTFTVTGPDTSFRFEGTDNGSTATATPLALIQDPGIPSFYRTASIGSGSIDPPGDEDYWSFTAQAGDRVLLGVSVPENSIRLRTELSAADGRSFPVDFQGASELLDPVVIPEDGTYYVSLSRSEGANRGDYELHVYLARGAEVESDGRRSNDFIESANPLTFTQDGNYRRAQIVGVVSDSGAYGDRDTFALGPLGAGNQVELTANVPEGSTFSSIVQLLDSQENPIPDEDGNPADGHFRGTVPAADKYYARIHSPTGSLPDDAGPGVRASYVLDVDVFDMTGPRVVDVTRLENDSVIDQWVATFDIQFDEKLNLALEDLPPGPDSDDDGFPDSHDPYPDEPFVGFDLREAGADETFGTADDDVYPLDFVYDGDLLVNVTVAHGPLAPGRYELRVMADITDVMGIPLDGNGDGVRGDDFVRHFTVAAPKAGFLFEGRDNDGIDKATPLNLVQDPELTSFYTAEQYGSGSIDPIDDVDYWSFQAKAGDHILIYTSSDRPYTTTTLFDGTGRVPLRASSGLLNSGVVGRYEIEEDGTYYVAIRGSVPAHYEVYVHLARGSQMESEYDYSNNAISTADQLLLDFDSRRSHGQMVGLMQLPWHPYASDSDVFSLGLVHAGKTVELTARVPSGSTFDGFVRLVDSDNREVPDQDGNGLDGHFVGQVPADGLYYAQVTYDTIFEQQRTYNGHTYVLGDARDASFAEGLARRLGGYLVSINDDAENAWLTETFADAGLFWIGLDGSPESEWLRWADGTTGGYSSWAPNEPGHRNPGKHATLDPADGLWRSRPESWPARVMVEIPRTDGIPKGRAQGPLATYALDVEVADPVPPQVLEVTGLGDVGAEELISSFEVTFDAPMVQPGESDPDNGIDFRAAGADGLFDTSDDIVHAMAYSLSDVQRSMMVHVLDGPLQPGNHRLRLTGALTDTSGRSLDGDSDGVPGGDYVFAFTVGPPPDEQSASLSGVVYVDVNNDGLRQSSEVGLPGVEIVLSGPVSKSVFTAADGSYQFDGLPPGVYRVEQKQPEWFVDGRETIGNPPLGRLLNDRFLEVALAEGTRATDYHFAERGLKAEYASKIEYLADVDCSQLDGPINPATALVCHPDSVPILPTVDNPLDINRDGWLSPIDALMLIDHLNAAGASSTLLVGDDPGYDVNGDGWCTPVDALIVIDGLSRESRIPPQDLRQQGEGEQAGSLLGPFAVDAALAGARSAHSIAGGERSREQNDTNAFPLILPSQPAALQQPRLSESLTHRDAVFESLDKTLLVDPLEDVARLVAESLGFPAMNRS